MSATILETINVYVDIQDDPRTRSSPTAVPSTRIRRSRWGSSTEPFAPSLGAHGLFQKSRWLDRLGLSRPHTPSAGKKQERGQAQVVRRARKGSHSTIPAGDGGLSATLFRRPSRETGRPTYFDPQVVNEGGGEGETTPTVNSTRSATQ